MSGMPPLHEAAPRRDAAPSPAPARLRRPGWRDPRLAVGLLLVAAGTLGGARLLASADDSVAVWATTGSVRAGDPVGEADLVPSRVALADGATESTYLSASAVPGGVFTRDLGAGEIVPAGAVGAAPRDDGADLSLLVEDGDAPFDLAAGDVVDVWAVRTDGAGGPTRRAGPLLESVRVSSVRSGGALATPGRQVVVAVDERDGDLGDVIGALADGRPVLVRVGGS